MQRAGVARIGVLAVQGAFAKHGEVLESLGHRVVFVRAARDLDGLDGLVLPGGESSVQLEMIQRLDLEAPIRRFPGPILATCAGLILLASEVSPSQRSLGLVDVTVARNAWGRQIDSFEARDDAGARDLVFIRAPRILRVGPSVRILATFRGEPVLIRQGKITCATFHPELTPDASLHARALSAEP
jgi:5'-phosphate synthase pdxT subunit